MTRTNHFAFSFGSEAGGTRAATNLGCYQTSIESAAKMRSNSAA
jgi:hypothetical protein